MDRSFLFVLNDAPYGTERPYNALRLAGAIGKREGTEVRIFLMGDAVGCAVAGQTVPNGFYNLDRMLTSIMGHGGAVACCGSCMDARGITAEWLVDGAARSTLDELSDWTIVADQVIVF